MKIHDPSPSELQKMDDLLTKIKLESFKLQACIRDRNEVSDKVKKLDNIMKEKNAFIEDLRKLVREWSYVPLCAACYLENITITKYRNKVTELDKMDEIIMKIQFESLHLHIYKKYLAATTKKKSVLLKELRELVEPWPYVPYSAQALLDDFHE